MFVSRAAVPLLACKSHIAKRSVLSGVSQSPHHPPGPLSPWVWVGEGAVCNVGLGPTVRPGGTWPQGVGVLPSRPGKSEAASLFLGFGNSSGEGSECLLSGEGADHSPGTLWTHPHSPREMDEALQPSETSRGRLHCEKRHAGICELLLRLFSPAGWEGLRLWLCCQSAPGTSRRWGRTRGQRRLPGAGEGAGSSAGRVGATVTSGRPYAAGVRYQGCPGCAGSGSRVGQSFPYVFCPLPQKPPQVWGGDRQL